MEKVDPVCIICGVSRRSLLYADDQWQVYQCENCGLGVLDPRPDKDELNRLYTDDYFQSHYQDGDKTPLTRNFHADTPST